ALAELRHARCYAAPPLASQANVLRRHSPRVRDPAPTTPGRATSRRALARELVASGRDVVREIDGAAGLGLGENADVDRHLERARVSRADPYAVLKRCLPFPSWRCSPSAMLAAVLRDCDRLGRRDRASARRFEATGRARNAPRRARA